MRLLVTLAFLLSLSMSQPVKVTFFGMSKCPDYAAAFEAFSPTFQKISAIADIEINFIGSFNTSGFFCRHGPGECVGDMQQLVAISQQSSWSDDSVTDLISCQSSSQSQIPDNFEQCASQAGLNATKIMIGVNGSLGPALLQQSFRTSQQAEIDVSCTVQLNDQTWCVHDSDWQGCNEGTTAQDLFEAVCKRYNGTNKAQVQYIAIDG